MTVLHFISTIDCLDHCIMPGPLSPVHWSQYSALRFELRWHIDYISSKISKSLNIIAKLKRHVSVQSLVSVYYALDHPYLTYECILLGNKYEAPLSQLVKLQNEAIRIINNVPIRDHVISYYVGLGLIKLPDMIKLCTCQLFYDHIVDKKSSNFALSFVSETHDYVIRSTSLQHMNLSPFRINIRKFFPTVLGCYYWNDIPISIREKPTEKIFKRALFWHYLSQYWLMSSSDLFYLNICCLRCDSYSLSYICILYLYVVSYILLYRFLLLYEKNIR